MTVTNIEWWPRHMLRAVSSSFTLGTLNGQVQPIFSARPRVFADPFERRWFCTFQSPPMGESESGEVGTASFKPSFREAQGRIRKMVGSACGVRVFDQFAKEPQYNVEHAGTPSNWSDGSTWSDGSRWTSGFLPPYITVDEDAEVGDGSIVVRGLPASITRVFRIDDRFEIEPNGARVNYCHYYAIDDDCRTTAAGKVRIYFSPGLTAAVKAGDSVRLKYPAAVMVATDDKQGEIQRGLTTGSFGVTLVGVLPSD